MLHLLRVAFIAYVLLVSTSCGGGGGGGGSFDSGSDARRGGLESANFDCDGSCRNLNLTVDDVKLILSNALVGAQALGVAATVAVTDRVGNVLAVYEMEGAAPLTTINGQIGATGGLEGASVPSSLAAISKAGTGAFLSSQGNAFTTRTASQIVQENFNPGERNQPGGPLFGVQFSQLLCSDVNQLNPELSSGRPTGSKPKAGGLTGPRPLPLGLAADPGGIPLYKQGDLVGGLGIELDGIYTLDRNILDTDDDIEERLALIASRGFEAPSDRTAPNIFIVGKSFRYTDLDYDDLDPMIEVFIEPDPSRLLAIPEFTDGTIRAGAVFGNPSSGVAKTVRAGVPAAVLVNASGAPRFPSRDGAPLPGGVELKAHEVEALLDSALLTAHRARAAIRRPLDTPARVSIWIIDTEGTPLGFVRSQDAPVFGIDVALQKARGAAFFSSADAGAQLEAAGFGGYVSAARTLLGADALTGTHAFADRALGNLSRPYFPDGITGNSNGPFSHPFPGSSAGPTWSPFNTGIQLDLVAGAVLQALSGSGPIPDSCAFTRRIANGIQIFPGSVPLYRDGVLIGGIGISGDGVDQDDLVAFYGASRPGLDFAGHGGIGDPELGFNAPIEIRSDQIPLAADNLRLRFVNCPEAPFSGSNEQNVCDKL